MTDSEMMHLLIGKRYSELSEVGRQLCDYYIKCKHIRVNMNGVITWNR